MSDVYDILKENAAHIEEPGSATGIYKDECVYSFDTPDSEDGLYVCLATFWGLGKRFVERHHQRFGNSVYLHLKRDKLEIKPANTDGPERKVTRLAIGLQGGFDTDSPEYEINETVSLVVMPGFRPVPWPNDKVPLKIANCVKKVLETDSALEKAECEAMTGTWDGEIRQVSKHAKDLVQLDNGVKVPPKGWQCAKCDLNNNLWMNLTDGMILCGRKFFDGTGGNEHALHHYRETGYPLAVKLGTITKEGKGDVFSYVEDDMVEDPLLTTHLAHFGINILNMEKTDKSMAEIEVDLNQKLGEWSTLQESGSQLSPLYGPGYTGIANMGNSCYMNAVLQVIFSLPQFISQYYDEKEKLYCDRKFNADPAGSFIIQMCKVADGLLSGRYSMEQHNTLPKKVVPPIAPAMFRNVTCKNHPEFSTKNQQDAQEFLLYLFSVIQKNKINGTDPTDSFKMQVEDRFECGTTGKVKYRLRTEYCLPLPIPLSEAINKEQVRLYEENKSSNDKLSCSDLVRPKIKLQSCLEAFSGEEVIEQFFSSAINAKTTAKKRTRLSSLPDYLLVHLRKFMMREDWVPMKLDVEVEMPWELELGGLRGGVGELRPGEQALPEDPSIPAPVLDQQTLDTLTNMGFPLDAAKKAVYFTGNSGPEEATNWLTAHVADPDFLSPFIAPGQNPSAQPAFVPNPEGLSMLMSMGFDVSQATRALKKSNNNLERAADCIFSLGPEDEPAPPACTTPSSDQTFTDGPSSYRLKAFISHMGSSSMVGHYVCHILKDNQWVIYNDEKVARSENPPKDLGYLYLYERIKT